MNDTTIYVGTYIKVKMPTSREMSNRKQCPVCTHKGASNTYCPIHGEALVEFYEIVSSSPFDLLVTIFENNPDAFAYHLFGYDDEDVVCFTPNQGQGGRYIHSDEDEEIEIPPYNLDGDWQTLITYLLESEIEHEVKYGILIVGEK